jgi:hypothetical protein
MKTSTKYYKNKKDNIRKGRGVEVVTHTKLYKKKIGGKKKSILAPFYIIILLFLLSQ